MGLMRMAARTAVVAGTATAVSGNVARRQRGRQIQAEQAAAYQRQQAAAAYPAPAPAPAPAAAPAPTAAGGDDLIARLEQLANLKAQGVLSEAEFAAAKAKLLGL